MASYNVLFCLVAFVTAIAFTAKIPHSQQAILGIDLGSEYIKVASVKPGTPFHIVVDEQTKRKFPTVVAFDSGERYFANNGIAFSAKRPSLTYQWHPLLLGSTLSSPAVSLYREEGYAYTIESNSSRGGALYFKHEEPGMTSMSLSTEELVAMNLQHVLKLAEADAETAAGTVKDAVITVPNYFTQKQRQALLDAAELAGVNVLSLLHENTAAAIQYGIDRKYDSSSINSTHTVLFVNIGSTATQVDLAVYSGYAVKSGPSKKDKDLKVVGQVEVRYSAADAWLGGRAFERAIVDWLVTEVNKGLNAKSNEVIDVRTLPRAMSKIRTAAEKAKVVLSANTETPVFLSAVHNDMDFKLHITREKFLELVKPLIDRIQIPIQKVLDEAKIEPSDVDAVLIIGGTVRIPAVQQAIKTAMRREYLNQSLNGDEAMVFGALFRAANLSTTFKVRPFGVIDSTPYAVGVRIADLENALADSADSSEATPESSEREAAEVFSKRASLFKRNNQLDKRKLVSFSHTRDFTASLFHDDASKLPEGQTAPIGIYTVTGINDIIKNEKHAEILKTQKPRVSLSFELDWSGLVTLPRAEATLEENVTVCTPVKKIKTTANNTNATANTTDAADAEVNADGEAKSESEAAETKSASEGADASADANADASADASADTSSEAPTSTTTSETVPGATDKEPVEEECVTKKKTHTFKLKIRFGAAPDSLAPLTRSDRSFMRSRLATFTRRDDVKREIAAAQNTVESFIYSSRSTMTEDDVVAVSTDEQREEALKALEEAEEWLYEKRQNDDAEVYKTKLNSLRSLVDPILFRRSEVTARAEAASTASTVFAHVKSSLLEFANRPWLKADDVEKLTKLNEEAEAWLSTQEAAQATTSASDKPAWESRELLEKLRVIANLAQSLEKVKKPVEKPAPKPKKVKSGAEGANETDPAESNTTSTNTTDPESNTNANAEGESSSDGEPTQTGPETKDEL